MKTVAGECDAADALERAGGRGGSGGGRGQEQAADVVAVEARTLLLDCPPSAPSARSG
jgi:hypothetical protein